MTSPARGRRTTPPYLLERVAQSHPDNAVRERVQATLQQDTRIRALRASVSGPAAVARGAFEVYDAHQITDLPGGLVRGAGDPPSGEAGVDDAYAGVDATLSLYQDVYERASYDGNGAKVVSTVHYDQHYDNAFWNG